MSGKQGIDDGGGSLLPPAQVLADRHFQLPLIVVGISFVRRLVDECRDLIVDLKQLF